MTDDKRKIINFQPDDLDRQSNAENSDTRAGNKGVGSSDDDMSDEVNSAVQSKIKGDKQKLLEVELPTALAEREIKLYLSAILTGLLSVVGSITLMSVGLLVLLALAAFFIYTALSSRMDFRDGKIV